MKLRIRLHKTKNLYSNVVTWNKKRKGMFLCDSIAKKYFDIPEEIKVIDLIISNRKSANSYKVKAVGYWHSPKIKLEGKRNGITMYFDLYEYLKHRDLLGKELYASIEY